MTVGASQVRGEFLNIWGGLAMNAPRKIATARPNQIILSQVAKIGKDLV